jgi:hypothetical protein
LLKISDKDKILKAVREKRDHSREKDYKDASRFHTGNVPEQIVE